MAAKVCTHDTTIVVITLVKDDVVSSMEANPNWNLKQLYIFQALWEKRNHVLLLTTVVFSQHMNFRSVHNSLTLIKPTL